MRQLQMFLPVSGGMVLPMGPRCPDPRPYPYPPKRRRQILALSGGKDSTAAALALHERGERFECLFTPTGRELPGVMEYVRDLVAHVGSVLHLPPAPTLDKLITDLDALPNNRQRWCTRMIKIVPCIAWLRANPGCTLLVGLRADEEERVGLYGDFAEYRYPLREFGWDIDDVKAYVRAKGAKVKARTDCDVCYGQRLSEWWNLWHMFPDRWADGEAYEKKTGHTFRSPTRDTWPASMADLRGLFALGYKPRGADEYGDEDKACRVCSL